MQAKIKAIQETLYRKEPDADGRWLLRWSHWAVVIVYLLFVRYFFNHFASFARTDTYKQVLSYVLALYLIKRYILNRKLYDPDKRLPLYSCNISAIILALAYFIDSDSFWWNAILAWAVLSGLYGGFLAIVFAYPGDYVFPHVTYFDYYIGHFCISIIGLGYILEQKQPLSTDILAVTCIINVIYLLIMNIINPLLGSNFGFITTAPDPVSFVKNYVTLPVYKFSTVMVYLIINTVTWLVANYLIIS